MHTETSKAIKNDRNQRIQTSESMTFVSKAGIAIISTEC